MTIYDIGVYGKNEDEFFDALVSEGIELFIDIRQRRGMRGSQYSFVNSTYLQNKLKQLDIEYWYIRKLAPTTEIRNAQKEHDILMKTEKQKRKSLGNVFIEQYQKQVLDDFDLELIIPSILQKNTVFFCVEKECLACHRHLVTEKLYKEYKLESRHL